MKPRVAFLSIHPAPYRDPVLEELTRRSNIDLHVFLLFNQDTGHAYWDIPEYMYSRSCPSSTLLCNRLHFSRSMLRSVTPQSYDVVVIPGYYHPTCQALLFAEGWNRQARVYFSDSILASTAVSSYRRIVKPFITRQVLRRVDAAWVPGSAAHKYLELHGLPNRKIFEGAYCLDVAALLRKLCSATGRLGDNNKRYRTPDSMVFLMVAGFTKKRAYPLLLQSFAAILGEVPGARLLLVGDGPEYDNVQRLAHAMAIEKSVRFLGPLSFDQLNQVYAASDIYVHSSTAEEYSLALIQAAIAGLPIISSDGVGAAYDVLVQDHSGFWASAGSVDSLAKAMKRALHRIEALPQMGAKAREYAVLRNVDWAATQFERCVETALH